MSSVQSRDQPAGVDGPGGPARSDDPLRGIMLVLGAAVLFSVSDVVAKHLSAELPTTQIVWMRWVGFVLIMLPLMARRRGWALRTQLPGLQALRSVVLAGSSLFFIAGLGMLPMASATTMSFISPLLVTALSIPLLGERVGPRRWAAVLVGLAGMLIVVRPGTASFEPASVFPLVSALFWAVGMIITRRISGTDGPVTTMIYSALGGFVLLSLVVPFGWITPDLRQAGWSALMALASTGAQFLVVNGYRYAAASVLAPLSYTQLVWSGGMGFLVYASVPDRWTVVGAVVIIGSGLYTAHRERLAHAARRAGTGQGA